MPWLGECSRELDTHTACVLAGEMPRVETSKMAANSVKESLASLADEPHPSLVTRLLFAEQENFLVNCLYHFGSNILKSPCCHVNWIACEFENALVNNKF